MDKPTYSTTKNALWWSLGLGWLVLILLTGGALYGQRLAVDLAGIMAPSMVALIVSILGVHRAFGSMDMRTIAHLKDGRSFRSPIAHSKAENLVKSSRAASPERAA